MSGLVKIVLAGFVAFMLLAMTQEWELFYTSWFVKAEAEEDSLDTEQQEATAAIRLTLELMRHLYASGGDPRFAERIPASESVVDEMQQDIDYLAINHRRQEPGLLKFEVASIQSLGEDRIEVTTREFWQWKIDWIDGSGEAEPARYEVVHGRYLVVRGAKGWAVAAWDFDLDPQPADEGAEP